MDFYIDVLTKPDAEMRENVLLNTIYTKFHKALYELNSTVIGVSFPQYSTRLGKILRIHGAEQNLSKLQEVQWLGGMAGYCDVSAILAVPSPTKHRVISRKQSNMKQSKLKRLIKRNFISAEEIKLYKAKMFSVSLSEPYLELISTSNKQSYRRYIHFGDLLDKPVAGLFDHFGLSKTATVPIF